MKPEIQDDERAGLPSASIITRIANCPGSLRLTRGLPELVAPQMRKYAESGDRVHLYLEAPDFVDLTPWPDELEVAKQCESIRDQVVKGSISLPTNVIKERRFTLTSKNTVEMRDPTPYDKFSAKLDYGAVNKHNALLVVDYKSGRGDQPEASNNLQLRSQLVVLWIYNGRKPRLGYTSVVQPLVSSKPEICEYDRAALEAAEKELLGLLEGAQNKFAPLIAGDHCKFCPAKLKCPAAVEVVKQMAEVEITSLLGIKPEALADLLNKAIVCDQVITAARAHAKAHLKERPGCIPGWQLTPNPAKRSVTDPNGAFVALERGGVIDQDTFIGCVSVALGKLEKAIKAFTDKKGGSKFTAKEITKMVNTACEDFIESKPTEPSLEKVST